MCFDTAQCAKIHLIFIFGSLLTMKVYLELYDDLILSTLIFVCTVWEMYENFVRYVSCRLHFFLLLGECVLRVCVCVSVRERMWICGSPLSDSIPPLTAHTVQSWTSEHWCIWGYRAIYVKSQSLSIHTYFWYGRWGFCFFIVAIRIFNVENDLLDNFMKTHYSFRSVRNFSNSKNFTFPTTKNSVINAHEKDFSLWIMLAKAEWNLNFPCWISMKRGK